MDLFLDYTVRAPKINPVNNKALSVPVLNPFDKYGRTFFFSWLGFFVAFLSWFAWPPLLAKTIKKDLEMTKNDVANSNIVALLATLIVRVAIGPLCDKFGPRWVMIGCLLLGAIPTALTPCVTKPSHVIAIRFFVGILGGTFVPCQVWTTGWFANNCVGRVNALAAGWGNSGGGVTYFVMPAVYQGLMRNGYTSDRAWRLSFVVCPFIIIVVVALGMIFFAEDTPNGPWSQQIQVIESKNQDVENTAESSLTAQKTAEDPEGVPQSSSETNDNSQAGSHAHKVHAPHLHAPHLHAPHLHAPHLDLHRHEVTEKERIVIEKPTLIGTLKTMISPYTLLTAGPYMCSFGTELAVNSILSSFYIASSKKAYGKANAWDESFAGDYAAMFGLINIVTRPAGGLVSDYLYRETGLVLMKKYWMIVLGVLQGIFLLWIGVLPNLTPYQLVGGHVGLAILLEAANGANFSLVPHIAAAHNGIVSGVTGGAGNLGGIFFALIFRFVDGYHHAYWIIAIIVIAVNGLSVLIPLPPNARKRVP